MLQALGLPEAPAWVTNSAAHAAAVVTPLEDQTARREDGSLGFTLFFPRDDFLETLKSLPIHYDSLQTPRASLTSVKETIAEGKMARGAETGLRFRMPCQG